MNVKKPTLAMKDTAAEPPATNGTTRDLKTHQPMFYRPEGFVLEIDGKFKSDYKTSADAMKAGLELKKKFPFIQVIVYAAKERTRTLVTLPE